MREVAEAEDKKKRKIKSVRIYTMYNSKYWKKEIYIYRRLFSQLERYCIIVAAS